MRAASSTAHTQVLDRKPQVGDIIIVRYFDHVLFKDALISSDALRPVVRETVGWLDFENEEFIRLVWERFSEPVSGDDSRLRTTGLAIRKSDVIELRRVK